MYYRVLRVTKISPFGPSQYDRDNATMTDRRRSRFRPCIDLHDGKVKQIVGGTLSDDDPGALKTNFIARCDRRRAWISLIISSQSAGDFARLYKEHGLQGGHVIMLGPRNRDAAREALGAWPGTPPTSMAGQRDLISLTRRFTDRRRNNGCECTRMAGCGC